jgi:hypothetical protein
LHYGKNDYNFMHIFCSHHLYTLLWKLWHNSKANPLPLFGFGSLNEDIRSNFRVIKNLAQNPTLLYFTLLRKIVNYQVNKTMSRAE